MLREPMLPDSGVRVLPLVGGVNGLYPPRLPFGIDEFEVPALRFAELFISRALDSRPVGSRMFDVTPALGFCMVPLAEVPRADIDSVPRDSAPRDSPP
jgi:hypothetical protein